MAPDSAILNGFHLDEAKCHHNISWFGTIDSLPFYCILFDESLNEILQQEQLDVHIDFGSHHSILWLEISSQTKCWKAHEANGREHWNF